MSQTKITFTLHRFEEEGAVGYIIDSTDMLIEGAFNWNDVDKLLFSKENQLHDIGEEIKMETNIPKEVTIKIWEDSDGDERMPRTWIDYEIISNIKTK